MQLDPREKNHLFWVKWRALNITRTSSSKIPILANKFTQQQWYSHQIWIVLIIKYY